MLEVNRVTHISEDNKTLIAYFVGDEYQQLLKERELSRMSKDRNKIEAKVTTDGKTFTCKIKPKDALLLGHPIRFEMSEVKA